MQEIMLGNQAVARGLFEAGVTVVASYPGTPSTEITEFAAKYKEIHAQWSANEKVATEVSIGAAIGGARAFSAMKHVGLNVAADPLFTVSYTGINGGLVIAVADDPGMHSSQNEQDSRHYARAAKVPMLEPSDSDECISFVKRAYEISEEYDTPVILRLTTRVAHSQSVVNLGERHEVELRDYVKNPQKYVMMPAMAKGRHDIVEKRTIKLKDFAEATDLNKIVYNDKKIGIITSGISYQYAKEALPNASFLKLGMVFPLPKKLIEEFVSQCETVYVIEELDDIFETYIKKCGLKVIGKELFSYQGELSANIIKEKILGSKPNTYEYDEPIANRPPAMCPGCPHRGVFYVLSKNKIGVMGDIGCYTLGALPPLSALDTCVCMGAGIGMLNGFEKARGVQNSEKMVAVIGESTFVHSGITGLIDIVYNKGNGTVIILDNSITGMTGHQQNPTTGITLKGEPTQSIDLLMLCKSIGINRVSVVDPFDIMSFEKVLKEELSAKEPSVIIAQRPCALLKHVKHDKPYATDPDICVGCKMCMKLGCPAISIKERKMTIDTTLCNGCGLCKKVCKFGAIQGGESFE